MVEGRDTMIGMGVGAGALGGEERASRRESPRPSLSRRRSGSIHQLRLRHRSLLTKLCLRVSHRC